MPDYYYLYFIFIFFIVILFYYLFFKPREKHYFDEAAFDKLNLANSILSHMEKEGIDTAAYREEYKRCQILYENRNYLDSKDCFENLLKNMQRDRTDLAFKKFQGNFKVCKNCGEKVYGNFIFCPKCGGPL